MMELVIGSAAYSGVEQIGDAVRCEKCHGDKKARQTMHLDAEDYFTNTYQCDCGNVISVTIKRKWGGA